MTEQMQQLISNKMRLDYTHEVLSKVTSVKNILSKALTEGLYDRDFYLATIRHVLIVEVETKNKIKQLEKDIAAAGYDFSRHRVTNRFEIRH